MRNPSVNEVAKVAQVGRGGQGRAVFLYSLSLHAQLFRGGGDFAFSSDFIWYKASGHLFTGTNHYYLWLSIRTFHTDCHSSCFQSNTEHACHYHTKAK